jgi:protein-tyrosine-phosphatase
MTGKLVLFVCTANQCRSVMAEALLRRSIAGMSEKTDEAAAIVVASAGVDAVAAMAPIPNTVTAMNSLGVDISAHRARRLTPDMIADAALVLTMTRDHKEVARLEAPDHARKVIQLTELVGYKFDIADPANGSVGDSYRTAQEIDSLLTRGMPALLKRIDVTEGATR